MRWGTRRTTHRQLIEVLLRDATAAAPFPLKLAWAVQSIQEILKFIYIYIHINIYTYIHVYIIIHVYIRRASGPMAC